ncbi:hypothetical protein O7627_06870 [Solwaraspora sp. WMMD1047]|uniref:hypothetical protein n=1 Tax=Solwaraspora sp. WMMD1047 TaxID=3016102 RepID=UPI002415EA68|nr:hypothetical protein [Solwaraspora sp. WMMD1047]MDG4829028.1 hypothetical protein [Solwaraspora sp. WMMD1047]
MSDDAAPFFIRPHRFDDPGPDDAAFPAIDGHHRILLDEGERVLRSERLRVSGYLVGPAAGERELHWRLSRPADVIVTDRRLAFVCPDWAAGPESSVERAGVRGIQSGARHRPPRGGSRLAVGQVRWQWPSRLQLLTAAAPPPGPPAAGFTETRAADGFPGVRPAGGTPVRPRSAGPVPNLRGGGPFSGARGAGTPTNGGPGPVGRPAESWFGQPANGGPGHARPAPAAGGLPAGGRWGGPAAPDDELLIVCDALRATRQPALALAAGPHRPARTVRDLAVVTRQAIAQFRLANPRTVDLAPPERDALRARAGLAAFADELTDPVRGLTMPGALVVEFLDRDDYYRWSPRRGRRRAESSDRSSSGLTGPAS